MSAPPPPPPPGLDALLPEEMARKAEALGVAKALRDPWRTLALAVLAGAFIAFGAWFSLVAMAGAAGEMPFGVTRLIGGLVFSLGLILVVAGGAELFTGDVLMVMAWASGRLALGRMLAAWAVIYLGNAIGAAGTAVLIFAGGAHRLGDGAVARLLLAGAEAKAGLGWGEAFVLGMLCNVLVCLAVWASLGARSLTDKVAVVVLPVAAFVAAGFEHSIANLFLLPLAFMVQAGAGPELWGAVLPAPGQLGLAGAARNLVAVTAGNVAGGGALVAAVYWFIYLRPARRP